jgi:putative Ca2+/H+ antiporter (TMEM165/GDT1 family)
MDWPIFISTFSLIFLAELPDKTALATLMMATRGKPVPIFIGVGCAFAVQSLVGVAFGGLIGQFPERWVHLAAGILFIGFGLYSYFDGHEEEAASAAPTPKSFLGAAWKAFLVIFIAEWGDLTQLATASLAARYHHSLATIFVSATLALWLVTAIAITIGHKMRHAVSPVFLKKICTLVFLAVGAYFLGTWCMET